MSRSIDILHIEDESDLAVLVATQLEDYDDRMTVDTAPNAIEGQAMLESHDYDCVVCDYDLPGTNGLEFLDTIRETEPDLPVILHTGKGSERVASEAISRGVSDYLQKTSDPEHYTVLAKRIDNLVTRRQAEHDLETRLRQQAEVGEIGQAALSGQSLDAIFKRAVEAVSGALDTEFVKILEYQPANEQLRFRAGRGWDDHVDRGTVVPGGEQSQAGYTLRSKAPVVVTSLESDDRFEGPDLLTDHGVVSGISVLIGHVDDPWGILGAHSATYTPLSQHDVTFVQNVANTLANAIERREHEEEHELYRTMVETVPDAVYAQDAERRFIAVNDGMTQLTGIPREELLGGPVSLVLDEEDLARAKANRDRLRQRDEESIVHEFELQTEADETIPVENRFRQLPSDDDTFHGTAGVIRDITARKHREEELRRQNERLEELTNAVSHDLRNPLNVAQGRLDFAKEVCQTEHLDAVEIAHERMQTLIDDVLELARTGKSVANLERLTLDTIVDESWANVETADATLHNQVEEVVHADETRMKQLFENLFRNAIEHGGSDVAITVGAFDSGLFVEDTGPGIPENKREQIFEAGYSTSPDGSGLGLNIVNQIVDDHDWDIHVTSGEGGGTRFEISDIEFLSSAE